MKPRPLFSALVLSARSNSAVTSRNAYVRLGMGCGNWTDGMKRRTEWEGRGTYTSAATASKTGGYGSAMARISKGGKTSVPAKATVSPTASVPAKIPAAAKSQTTVLVAKAKSNLNPPPFTYAPDLHIPARKGDQSFVGYLWNAGRAYIAFYKAGISNVRQTSKLAKTLRSKAAGKPATEVLTRAEWQLVRRNKRDMIRLPAFGLLVLFLGEWLPLVVLYITPLIPEPCRIPQQVQRVHHKLQQTRHHRLKEIGRTGLALQARDPRTPGTTHDSLYELLLKSARYNCHSPIWDTLRLTPPKWLLRRNVRNTLEYIKTDDALIQRDGGYAALEKREVERALVERGCDVLGKREDELRREIVEWSRNRML